MARQVLLVTPNFDNNSLGRTHCLWLLGRELGWDVQVIGVKGTRVWAPLRDTDFAAACTLPEVSNADERLPPGEATDRMLAKAAWAELVIAVKPLPTSFGVARHLCSQQGRPLLLDIDDPDLEVRTEWRPAPYRWSQRVLSRRYRSLLELKRASATVPTTVSNPELQQTYGGVVIPHARPRRQVGPYDGTTAPVVRFVGSPRGHKGLDVLRKAVANVAHLGVRLEITAEPPPQPPAWETWVGATSFAAGQQLVATADVVAVPSLVGGWSPSQLPAKLIDAMSWGRAIVASRVGPIPWALADAGLIVPPGDVGALSRALEQLTEPGLRRALGMRAHQRADSSFSVPSLAPVLATHAEWIIDSWRATGDAGVRS